LLIKAIITGTTGMVGEGVLLECLNNPAVEQILVINRKPGEIYHPKLHEIIHADFMNLSAVELHLAGYDACFFCLGMSSVGISQQEYKHTTYDLTLNVAQVLAKSPPPWNWVNTKSRSMRSFRVWWTPRSPDMERG
jgi:nucleoside-diphosphate-sugar epimerase